MELALSLGDTDTQKPHSFLDKQQKILGTDLGFCMAADKVCSDGETINGIYKETTSSSDSPVQLDLLPFSPVHASHDEPNKFSVRWHNNIEGIYTANNSREGKADRGSDEEENGAMARKKLRLSKEQSSFLEESFKEHHTLNPKEKVALAKQLNLRPRQVEVWFQNRRARTKLKQTEGDCEYLKRWCEKLREENKRLHKELQDLRALKASTPFYMQLPATTLTMCPSCQRVAAAAAPASTTTGAPAANNLTQLSSLSTSNAEKTTSS